MGRPHELPRARPVRGGGVPVWVWVAAGVGAVAIAGAGIATLIAVGRVGRVPPTVEPPAAVRGPAEMSVDAEALLYAYENGNPAAADAKYTGKVVEVKGQVLEIEKTEAGEYAVGLVTSPNVTPDGRVLRASVQAFVRGANRDAVAGLNRFDTVAVTAKCLGSRPSNGTVGKVTVFLDDADVVLVKAFKVERPEPPPPRLKKGGNQPKPK